MPPGEMSVKGGGGVCAHVSQAPNFTRYHRVGSTMCLKHRIHCTHHTQHTPDNTPKHHTTQTTARVLEKCSTPQNANNCFVPMGLISALLQSYLVRYPLRHSSTLALPSTKSHPCRPLTHGTSCAIRNAKTMRKRAWMFCSARFSAGVPPSARKRGVLPVTAVKSVTRAWTTLSIQMSQWLLPI